MDIRQLTQFLSVIEHGSLRQAATALNVSEPALSKSIRRLEDTLGVSLFDRNARGMAPTIFGRTLADGAREVRRSLNQAVSEIEELRGLSRGTVRLGARPSFSMTILPMAISQLQQKRPGIRALHREGTTVNMLAELKRGDLDFIIITMNDELDEPELIQEYLTDSPVSVVSRKSHPLTRLRRIMPEDLLNYPWVLLPPPDPVRREIEGLFALKRVGQLNVAAESESVFFQMSYVAGSDALAYFPTPLVGRNRAYDQVRVLDIDGMAWRRKLAIVRRKDTSLPPAANHMITEIREVCAELGT